MRARGASVTLKESCGQSRVALEELFDESFADDFDDENESQTNPSSYPTKFKSAQAHIQLNLKDKKKLRPVVFKVSGDSLRGTPSEDFFMPLKLSKNNVSVSTPQGIENLNSTPAELKPGGRARSVFLGGLLKPRSLPESKHQNAAKSYTASQQNRLTSGHILLRRASISGEEIERQNRRRRSKERRQNIQNVYLRK